MLPEHRYCHCHHIPEESRGLGGVEGVGQRHVGAGPQSGGTCHPDTRLLQPVASRKVDGVFSSWCSHGVTCPQSLGSVSRAQAHELRHHTLSLPGPPCWVDPSTPQGGLSPPSVRSGSSCILGQSPCPAGQTVVSRC